MRYTAFLVCLLYFALPAQAQHVMTAADGFDAGLTLPWLLAEQTISLVAVGIFLGQCRNVGFVKIWSVFLIAMGIGLAIPPTTFSLLSLSVTLLSTAFVAGLLIALKRPLQILPVVIIGGFTGLLEGTASAPGPDNWYVVAGFIAGSTLRANLFFITAYLFADWLSGRESWPWAPIALRVIGSWMSAVCILMLALLLASPT
jgi:hydrogenase/urease accessory protein HupE